jgi:hypothetical protein
MLAPAGTASRVAWVASRLFVKSLTAYQYTSARAVTLAVRHVLAGPRFFRDNLDLQHVRREIGGWQPDEKLAPIDRDALVLRGGRRSPRESALRRLARVLTLQGFLLPGFLLRDRTTVQPKGFHGRASAVFRYRSVLYVHESSGTGFVAHHDRGRFFGELGRFLGDAVVLVRRLPALRRAYAAGADDLTSMAFWRGVYADAALPPATPPTLPSERSHATETAAP